MSGTPKSCEFDRPEPIRSVYLAGVEVRPGSRVRLHPRPGGDVLDLLLAGCCARVESLEEDYDSRIHVAVILDDDPGREFGLLRQAGHRFFFAPDELDPLEEGTGAR